MDNFGGPPFKTNGTPQRNVEPIVDQHTDKLLIDIEGAKTAFGELSVAQFQPQAGWIFAYNLNPSVILFTELFGGTVTHNGSFAELTTGTDPNAVAFVRTQRSLTYAPGIGALARFTATFDTPQENSLQLIGIINNTDGWAFGYNGLNFGIVRRRNGVDEWFYQEDWTENTYPTLNQQKGNVFEIKYQWLGFGMQYFGIENDNGDIETVHRIKYANLNDDVSISNPSLPIAAGVANQGNTTSITLKTPSAVAGLEGPAFSPVFETLIAYERIVTIGAGETYLFGLNSPDQWLGKENRLYVLPKLFTFATDGNKPVIIRVYAMPTITTPTWVDIAPNVSPLQYDEVGTWVPNGEQQVFTYALGKADNAQVNLSIIDAEVLPNQMYAITAETTAAGMDLVVGLNFKSRT